MKTPQPAKKIIEFNLSLVLCFLAWCSLPGLSNAQESTLRIEDDRDYHRTISESVGSLSKTIDTFFSQETYDADSKGSRFQVGYETLLDTEDQLQSKFRVRTKLELPKTKKKFQIFIDGSQNDGPNNDKGSLAEIDDDQENSESSGTGLRFINTLTEKTYFHTDAGVKIRGGLYSFLRFRAQIKEQNQLGKFKLSDELILSDTQGHSNKIKFTYDKEFDIKNLFRFSNTLLEKTDLDGFEIKHSFNFYHIFSDKIALSLFLWGKGFTQPVTAMDSYALGVNYRIRVKSKWFFVNLRPQFDYLKRYNFATKYSVMLNFEANFGSGYL